MKTQLHIFRFAIFVITVLAFGTLSFAGLKSSFVDLIANDDVVSVFMEEEETTADCEVTPGASGGMPFEPMMIDFIPKQEDYYDTSTLPTGVSPMNSFFGGGGGGGLPSSPSGNGGGDGGGTVTLTPEPTTILIFASALGLVPFCRRKK